MTRDDTEIRSMARANWVATNVGIPFVAFVSIFAGVVGTAIFALLLHPDVALEESPGASLATGGLMVGSSFAIFMGCYGVVVWQRARERLRRHQAGE